MAQNQSGDVHSAPPSWFITRKVVRLRGLEPEASLGMCVSRFGEPYGLLITAVREIFMYVNIYRASVRRIPMSWRAAWKSKYFKRSKWIFFFFARSDTPLVPSVESLRLPAAKTPHSLSTKAQKRCLHPLNEVWGLIPPTPYLPSTEPPSGVQAQLPINAPPIITKPCGDGKRTRKKRKKKTENSSLRAVSSRRRL